MERECAHQAFPSRPWIYPRFEGHRIIHELAGHVVLFTSLQMACSSVRSNFSTSFGSFFKRIFAFCE